MIIGDIAAVSSAIPTHPTSSSSSGPSYTTASGMGSGGGMGGGAAMGLSMAEGGLNSVSHTYIYIYTFIHTHTCIRTDTYMHIHTRSHTHTHIHLTVIYASITTSIIKSKVNTVLFSTSPTITPQHATPHTIISCYYNITNLPFILSFLSQITTLKSVQLLIKISYS